LKRWQSSNSAVYLSEPVIEKTLKQFLVSNSGWYFGTTTRLLILESACLFDKCVVLARAQQQSDRQVIADLHCVFLTPCYIHVELANIGAMREPPRTWQPLPFPACHVHSLFKAAK
jgi:hypothetical protein